MKARNAIQYSKNLFTGLFGLVFLLAFIYETAAQVNLYGPENPPPVGSSITFTGTENDGQIGFSGGKLYTITNIVLSNTTDVYFTILAGSVTLSMDGSGLSPGETLSYASGLSDPATGFLAWTGSTYIPIANDNGVGIKTYRPLLSKFTVTVLNQSNQPVSLVTPAVTGLDPETGGAALFQGTSTVIKVRMQMFVSDNGGSSWIPHLVYYNNAQTPAGAESAYSGYNYGFYWNNDPPKLTKNLVANVDEGDTLRFSSTFLQAEDVETPASDLMFIFDPREEQMLPAHGKLTLGHEMLAATDTFTMADVLSDTLMYIHDGSESVKDSIPLMLADSDDAKYMEGADSVFHFMINITPVDDDPVLLINAGGTVDEQDTLFIDETMLLTTDPESSPESITYKIDPQESSEYPKNGILKLNSIPLGDGDTFTQQDIADGKLHYQHDGTPTLSDGFLFTVEDEFGHLAEEDGATGFFFAITITPVNDPPKFITLQTLEINEDATGTITNALLAVEDEEHGPDEILFTLDPDFGVQQPLCGEVQLDGVTLEDGDVFTMDDVNNNLVTYVHDGSEEASDFFVFGVSDTEGGITRDGEFTTFHFNISITNINDQPVVENPVDDHSTKAGEPYDFTFPENTFTDEDTDDELSYSSMMADESALPAWLSFDPESRNFSGTPGEADVGVHSVVIIAQDLALAEARDTFELEVVTAVGIAPDMNSDIRIYPNPFTDHFTVELPIGLTTSVEVAVMNILGEQVRTIEIGPGEQFTVKMTEYPSGIYFVRVKSKGTTGTFRILKR